MGGLLIPGEGTDANYAINFYVYDANLMLLATIPSQTHQSSLSPVRGDGAHTYYVPQLNRTMITISDRGVVGGTAWALPANSDNMTAGTPNRAGTIYYYGSNSENPAAIHRYDLVNNTPLSDLFTEGGSLPRIGHDVLVQASGDLLVVVDTNHNASVYVVRRYHPDGTLVATYSGYAGMTAPSNRPRIALGLDDPNSFWIMAPKGQSFFTNVRTSDGSVITTFPIAQDASGLTGPASSCPLLVTQSGTLLVLNDNEGDTGGLLGAAYIVGSAGNTGHFAGSVLLPASEQAELFFTSFPNPPLGTVTTRGIRRLRRAPHLWDDALGNMVFYPGFELIFEAGGPRTLNSDPLIISLQYSNDSGHTFGSLRAMPAGELGNFRFRAQWQKTGSTRHGRVFQIIESNAAKMVLLDALLRPDPILGTS